jgi:hypothetical protein
VKEKQGRSKFLQSAISSCEAWLDSHSPFMARCASEHEAVPTGQRPGALLVVFGDKLVHGVSFPFPMERLEKHHILGALHEDLLS